MLKAYDGFSISAGRKEGSCLIFAHNIREARKLAYEQLKNWYDEHEWIDTGVSWPKGKDV